MEKETSETFFLLEGLNCYNYALQPVYCNKAYLLLVQASAKQKKL